MISTCFYLHCPVLIFHESILLIGCVCSFLRSYECQVAESELRLRSWRQFPPADIPIPLVFCCYCLVSKLCPSLCDPKDCSLPGSSIHGISQARILERLAISFSREPPIPGIKLASPALKGGFFTTYPPGKPSLGDSTKQGCRPSASCVQGCEHITWPQNTCAHCPGAGLAVGTSPGAWRLTALG